MAEGTSAVVSTGTAELYTLLKASRQDLPGVEVLSQILVSLHVQAGNMPDYLGLERPVYDWLLSRYYPGFKTESIIQPGRTLDLSRRDEMQELQSLLLENISVDTETGQAMSWLITAGCLGQDHLWQDLGLWSRKSLSLLMTTFFQPLALKNDKDMKWKKFLYKQLCETEGIYTCRSPSCEVCVDYQNCYGLEK